MLINRYRGSVFFYVTGFFLSILFMLDFTQTNLGLRDYAFTKYAPVGLMYVGAILAPKKRSVTYGGMLVAPILFAFAVLTSSLIYYFEGRSSGVILQDTFVGRGLNLTMLFPAFYLVRDVRLYEYFSAKVFGGLKLCSYVMAGISMLWFIRGGWFGLPHIYHTQLVVPLSFALVSLYLMPKLTFLNCAKMLFLLSIGVTVSKNTAYISLLISLICAFWLVKIQFEQEQWRRSNGLLFFGFTWSAGLIISVLVVIFMAYGIGRFVEYLPSGSPEVRLNSYAIRIEEFSSNYWLGYFFRGSPLIEFPTLLGTLVVPSHSDILDLLAFGGLFSLLFFLPWFFAIFKGFYFFSAAVRERDYLYFFLLSFLIMSVPVLGFNAVLGLSEYMMIFSISTMRFLSYKKTGVL